MSNSFFEKKSVTSSLAHRLIAAAEAKAIQSGVKAVIAVVDDSGVLKALSRMDGAPLLSLQVAQDKAYTAAAYGLPTDAWLNLVGSDPTRALGIIAGVKRLIVFGGGFPIRVNGHVVGGLGVSGGEEPQDMEIAKDALKALRVD